MPVRRTAIEGEQQSDGHGQSPHVGEPLRLMQPDELIDARDLDDYPFRHDEVRTMLADQVPWSSIGTRV